MLIYPLELIIYNAKVTISDQQENLCFACISVSKSDDIHAEGCSLILQNSMHIIVFNITHHDNNSLVLLECFSVQEAGEYSVHVFEIHNGEIMDYTSKQLDNIVISESEDEVCCEINNNA